MRMRITTVIAFLAALALPVGALAGGAGAGAKGSHGKVVALRATYTGKATTALNGSAVKVAAKGTGKGTLVGASKIAGKGNGATKNQCALVTGLGTITSKKKGTLKFRVLPGFSGCTVGDDQNQIAVKGKAKVAGGTKTFKKAKGTLTFTGHLDRGTGVFKVKVSGRVTL